MKKITFTLLASLTLLGSAYGQATYNLVAPANDNATSAFKPLNGLATHASQRSVMFINRYELLPMNLATITDIGFQYLAGTGSIPVPGNIIIYLENTSDVDMNKPGNFSTITATIGPSYYNGAYTVPGGSGPVTVPVTLSTPFNYTGGGLYVVWDYSSSGPFAASTASLSNNTDRTDWFYVNNAATPQNTMSTGVFRPSLTFTAVNTATNEIELVDISAPGKVAKLFGTPEDINTYVVNSSIGAQTNVSVTLNATGANPYNSVQVIPNMAAGATTTLNWNGYTPTTNGMSTITAVVLFPDQNLANNTKSWTQSVTCGSINHISPTFTLGNGYGFNTSGIFAAKHNIPGTSSLTAINVVIGSDAVNTGKQIYGVLTDAAGNVLATSSNTPNITASTTVALNFPPTPLTANTDYLFGMAQPVSGYFPAAYRINSRYKAPGYYTMPLVGGAPVEFDNMVSFGIEPVLQFGGYEITAVPNKTAVCKSSPQTITITATGADTYTWSSGLGNGSTVTLTPTGSGTATQVSVQGGYTTAAAAGCKSGQANVTFTLLACTGLSNNTANDAVKLFPNPTVSGKTNITGLSGENTITVYNTLGQVVLNQNTSSETATIDISAYPVGNYMVKITDSNRESRIIKIVNQN